MPAAAYGGTTTKADVMLRVSIIAHEITAQALRHAA
jgi:hypothetical protein